MQASHTRIALYLLITLPAYLIFGYSLERTDFIWLISTFAFLCLTYLLLLRETGKYKSGLKPGIAAAIIFRLVLLFSIPTLSDDFYRFIWDGNLLVHGINPFLETPETLLQTGSVPFLSQAIYEGLNSAPYFSVYPPICQFIFGLGAGLFGEHLLGNIVVMRVLIIAAEIGTIWILKKLLEHYKMNPSYLLVYALNPLVILELTGNLHFEGIMIFFLLLSFYLFLQNRYFWSILSFVFAVNTKLIPLLLIPYILFSLGWRRSVYMVGLLAAGTLLLHLPFLDPAFIEHFSNSLGLYFKTFEFNASIYYIVRWIGFQQEGYNIIQTAGPALAAVSTVLIVTISWIYRDRKLQNLPGLYIVLTALYYLFSTTVHPWYITSLLLFVPLTGIFFPLVWSLLVPLTYIAYRSPEFHENLWLVALEYLLVLAVMAFEIYKRKSSARKKLRWLFNLP